MAVLSFLKDIDQSLFLFLNSLHNEFWDIIMVLVTKTETWALFYLAILFFLAKKYRFKFLLLVIGIILAVTIGDQFSSFIKETVQRLRPTHDPALQDLVHNLYKKGGLYAFFSSHASNTFAVAFLTSKLFRNKAYTTLIFIWAALVSYSRIYLGLHYPLDILTGVAWGIFSGWLVYKLLVFTEQKIIWARFPKISETQLSRTEFIYFLIVSITFIAATMIVIWQLQHIDFL